MSLTLYNLPFSASDIFELFLFPCDPCRSSKWWNRPSLGASSRDTWACEPCRRKKNNGVRGLSRGPRRLHHSHRVRGGERIQGKIVFREDQATPTKYTEANGKVTDTAKKSHGSTTYTYSPFTSCFCISGLSYRLRGIEVFFPVTPGVVLSPELLSVPLSSSRSALRSPSLRPLRFLLYFYSLPLFLSLGGCVFVLWLFCCWRCWWNTLTVSFILFCHTQNWSLFTWCPNGFKK